MNNLVLRPYQTEARSLLMQGMREGHRRQILAIPAGGGKCLGFDTPVMLSSGEIKPVQDIRVGDRLMGPDGSPRIVTSLARGKEELFRVVPIKGQPYVVNASHILSLRKSTEKASFHLADGQYASVGRGIYNIDVRSFLATKRTARKDLKTWRAPLIQQFEREDACLEVPPYILGVWLGDGRADHPTISKPPCNLVSEWIAYAASMGLGCTLDKYEGKCNSYRITGGQRGGMSNPVLDAFRSIDVLGNKHIPEKYKCGSVEVRQELLAGLIDSDGHISHGGCDWISSSEQMAQDVAFIARSLGHAAYVSPCQKGIKATGFVGNYFRVSISGDISGLPMRDKKAPIRKQRKDVLVSQITLESMGEGDYYGFTIEGPDHLFLLGDFTVTHNTETAAYLMQESLRKGKRVVFVVDRIVLADQTSERLDRYGIPHGVLQSGHWRWHPELPLQIASAQTMESRGYPAEVDLWIPDECQDIRKSLTKVILERDAVVIGLSATPFKPALGQIFSNVVCNVTTNQLIEWGNLVPLIEYAAKPIDMKGAKTGADGEWTDKEVEKRGREIIGDIVATYHEKCLYHFGGPVKAVGFGATAQHCEEMARAFAAQGYDFRVITHATPDKVRRDTIADFREPDTTIHGLLTCEVFTRGFDVPDVRYGFSARPYKKALSNHIQQKARVMRSSPETGKTFAIWACHSLNSIRFLEDTADFWQNGITALDDKTLNLDKKTRQEPGEREIKECKCVCGAVLYPEDTKCSRCGKERVRTAKVEHVAGEVHALDNKGVMAEVVLQERREFYGQLLGHEKNKQYKKGWAANQYREKYKDWPPSSVTRDNTPLEVGPKVKGWITSRNIKRAFSRKRRASHAST